MAANKTKPALRDRDFEVLESLASFTLDMERQGVPNAWARPLDIGGSNGSHHSYTLTKLAGRFMVERKKWGSRRERGSCQYRMTRYGEATLELRGFYEKMKKARAHLEKVHGL